MAIEITLPKLSDTMEDGKILRWLKQVGDPVAPGDVVAEVETDKADMEVEVSDGGVLSEIRVQEGESAPVGAVLAVLDGERKGGANEGQPHPAAKGGQKAAPKAEQQQPEEPEEPEPEQPEPAPPAPEQRRAAAESTRARTAGEPEGGEGSVAGAANGAPETAREPRARDAGAAGSARKMRASPLAQRLARERGVDLQQVRGSGVEGKIVARDVEPTSPAPTPAAKPAPAPAAREARGPLVAAGRIELSKMRQSIARRMAEAKPGVPHFYVISEIDMDAAGDLLAELKQQVDPQITVSHLVVKAAAVALLEHPRVNGQWADGAVEIPSSINIGLAVAVDDGLIVPVIHDCANLSLREIAAEARRLVAAAREGRFGGDDLKGGTFSISNLGILDVDEFSAIINPPQAAILAVASIKERAVVRDGKLAVGRTMRVTLSCDHRQLNGVEGARYLEILKGALENPLRLLV